MKELLRKSIAAVAASASFVLVSGFGSDAMAAGVEGFGSIRTNLSDPSLVQIDTAYQHSTSLAAFKKLELRPVELDAAGQKLLQYSGEAQFGIAECYEAQAIAAEVKLEACNDPDAGCATGLFNLSDGTAAPGVVTCGDGLVTRATTTMVLVAGVPSPTCTRGDLQVAVVDEAGTELSRFAG